MLKKAASVTAKSTPSSLANINQELARVRLEIEKAKLAKLRREITEFDQAVDGYNAMASPTPEERIELLLRIDEIYKTLRASADTQRSESRDAARNKLWVRDHAKAP